MATVLSLDGGGSWALIQARTLGDLYGHTTPGHEILEHFDLVAGTSGGSLVLAGLACNWTPAQVAEKFLNEKERKQLFAPLWRSILNPMRILGIGPKYSAAAKLQGLIDILGTQNVAMNKLPDKIRGTGRRSPEFVIVGFDYDRKRAVFFRSSESRAASLSQHMHPTLAEAVHASTNAPVNFFDKPAMVKDRRMWDGAVGGYNNPVLAAVVEVLANGAKPADVKVLSIGTGTDLRPLETGAIRPPLATAKKGVSLARDVVQMATSILDDPPDAATFIAHVMLGQPLPRGSETVASTVIRMNPVIRPELRSGNSGQWGWPAGLTAEQWARLADIDMDATNDADVKLIDDFARAWLRGEVPNQAIRANADFEVEIGHDRYTQARVAWEGLTRAGVPGGT